MDDCDSLAEESDMEKQLLKDRIGKDKLDALSIASGGAAVAIVPTASSRHARMHVPPEFRRK